MWARLTELPRNILRCPSCIAPVWPTTTEAYNVSAGFQRGGKGLTNFLHLHTHGKRPCGERLATAFGPSRVVQWVATRAREAAVEYKLLARTS
jgi:hypothetical protein